MGIVDSDKKTPPTSPLHKPFPRSPKQFQEARVPVFDFREEVSKRCQGNGRGSPRGNDPQRYESSRFHPSQRLAGQTSLADADPAPQHPANSLSALEGVRYGGELGLASHERPDLSWPLHPGLMWWAVFL
jgi:hypothetical protein